MLPILAPAHALAAQARGGVHPHVADKTAWPVATGVFRESTPMLNFPDGVWNNGEGFSQRSNPNDPTFDTGGYLSPDLGEHLLVEDIQVSDNWHYSSPNAWRFVGFLRPAYLGTPTHVEDAAFELFASAPFEPSWPTVIFISTWQTEGAKAPEDGGRHAYPGDNAIRGLVFASRKPSDPWVIARPGPDSMRIVVEGLSRNFNVIAGYIVPRVFGRPLLLQMQRNAQLVAAIDLMLATPALRPPGYSQPGDCTVVIGGLSFGSLTSQLSALLYPDIYDGAACFSFNASLQRTPMEQEMLRYVTALSGFGPITMPYTPQDATSWPAFVRQAGSDYFSSSFTRRFRSNDVVRPTTFLVGDEDTVSSGTDSLPLMTGVRGYLHRAAGTNNHTSAWTAVMDKRCHEPGWYQTPIEGLTTFDATHQVFELIPEAIASHTTLPSPARPAALIPDDGSESPYTHVFGRGRWTPPPPPSPTDPLALDTTFSTNTAAPGVGLGYDESLKVRDGNVYVGSAEGVVTRFTVDAGSLELVAQARSEVLGYGAWALDVGEIDSESPGPEVAVATFRDVYLLDGVNLTVLSHRQLGEYGHGRPRRLQVYEGPLPFFPNLTACVVLATYHGHLLIFDGNLNLRSDYPEPGIQDLLVHDNLSVNPMTETASKVPITLLSGGRGHLVNLTVDPNVDPTTHQARLQASSAGQVGTAQDLECVYCSNDEKHRVAALFSNVDPTVRDHIRLFDPLTLAQVADVKVGVPLPNSPIMDMAITYSATGVEHYVVLAPPNLYLIDPAGQALEKDLRSFAPTCNALAVAVVDLIETDAQTFPDEVVLSTEGGHVVWFNVEELLTPTHKLNLARGVSGFEHTNRGLPATWGMVSRKRSTTDPGQNSLEVADQTGTRWRVNVSGSSPGSALFLHEIRSNRDREPPVTPVRSLVCLGATLQGADPSSGATWAVASLPGMDGVFETTPWQNFAPTLYPPSNTLWAQTDPLHVIPPRMPIYDQYLALPLAGAALLSGGSVPAAIGQVHWWGGDTAEPKWETYPNLIQGLYHDADSIVATWSSSDQDPAKNHDFRNLLKNSTMPAANQGAMVVLEDTEGPLIFATTSGGGFIVVRPGTDPSDRGTVLYSGLAEPDWQDYGYGASALCVRPSPGQPRVFDVFVGVGQHFANPQSHAAGQPDHAVGALAWLQFSPNSVPLVSEKDLLVFDKGVFDARGAYGVCGLALGDIVENEAGDELVVTTLDGDLIVLGIQSGTFAAFPLYRTWLEGSLGAYNSLAITDLDLDGDNELYVAGSSGIRRFRQQ